MIVVEDMLTLKQAPSHLGDMRSQAFG
ncbi:hypothetical protein NPIL_497751, partial [Nephila pilipes]